MTALKKQVQPVSSTIDDPTTTYARRVCDGEIVAGPAVRDACARHLSDLERGSERGLVWDLEASRRAIEFFEEVLRLNGGQFEGLPFLLLDWQLFIVGSLYGWQGPDGARRFRLAYVETAKGSGKSPLAAGIGLYGLTVDGEYRAEIYAAATKKDQAAILFRDAVAMVDQSPELAARITKSGAAGKEWNLAYHANGSFFKTIASDDSQSGPRPHVALLDEIHEHRTNTVVEMMRAGTKSRRQALIFMITNSGIDRTSVCYDYHDYATKVASGQIEDDAFFGYVCGIDDGDDPFKSESCWYKSNPSLAHGIPGYKYIREQVTQARGMPSKESVVRRLNFCQWTDGAEAWITRDVWDQCETVVNVADHRGNKCFGGLDLSYTTDLSAAAWVFPTGDGTADAIVDFWRPREGLIEAARGDRVPYDAWAKQGHLRLTDGKVIKLPNIAERIAELLDICAVSGIAYDRYRHKELADHLSDLGVEAPMIEHPQGFRRAGDHPLFMPNSVQLLENALIENRLRVHTNPVLRWNVSNAVMRDDPSGVGNRIFDKRKSRARIDGIVALAMAVGLWRATIKSQAEPSIVIL